MTDEKRNIAHWQSNLFHRRDRDRTGAVFPAHHVRTLASVFHQCCENDTVTFGSCGDRPDVVRVEVHYLLDSTDQGLAETISRKTGVPMETSKENMMGGVRAKIPGRNLLFDFAFSVLLQEEKDRFTFEGGYEHV